mgnify:CR=1 FL=1
MSKKDATAFAASLAATLIQGKTGVPRQHGIGLPSGRMTVLYGRTRHPARWFTARAIAWSETRRLALQAVRDLAGNYHHLVAEGGSENENSPASCGETGPDNAAAIAARCCGSGGCPAFNNIGDDRIGVYVLQASATITCPGKPEFGSFAVLGQMQQFDVLADVLHDADLADAWAFDNAEGQIAVDAVGAHDGNENDASLTEIPFMQGKAWRARIGRSLTGGFLANKAADAVATFPSG